MLVALLLPGLLARKWRTRLIAAGAWALFAGVVNVAFGGGPGAAVPAFGAAVIYQTALWFVREIVIGLFEKPGGSRSAAANADRIDAPDV
jgi:hypothetical protein